MNIFFLGLDPRVAAKYLCDKHIKITTNRLSQKLRSGTIVISLSGFSTDQKVILAVCATIFLSAVFVSSLVFIDNRISGYWKMRAFTECLLSNEKIVKENKSQFSPSLNSCRL